MSDNRQPPGAGPSKRTVVRPSSGAGDRVLVLGGARSGKSAYAELVAGESAADVVYVATGGERPDDAEWAARVAAHRDRRPTAWRTLETPDVATVLRDSSAGTTVLVDCLAMWLTGVLDDSGVWTADGSGRDEPMTYVAERIADLLNAWATSPATVVAVSNEVGSGLVPATPSGRLFRDELGRLNAALAAASDSAVLVVAGLPLLLKGACLPHLPEPRHLSPERGPAESAGGG